MKWSLSGRELTFKIEKQNNESPIKNNDISLENVNNNSHSNEIFSDDSIRINNSTKQGRNL